MYEDKIPAIGLFPVKSDLVKEYAGDILKDLPVLDEYVLWVLLRYYKTMGLFTTALVFTPILCSICVSLEMLLLWLGKVSHLCVLIKYSVNIIRKFWKGMRKSQYLIFSFNYLFVLVFSDSYSIFWNSYSECTICNWKASS